MKSIPSTDPTTNNALKEENYIIEIFKLVWPYKWLIIIMMLLSIVAAKAYLYFIPSTYNSYAIIKVKSDNEAVDREDLLRKNLFKTNSVGISQEISILKTYQINYQALKKVDFKIQYFVEDAYRKVELYKDSPIQIEELEDKSKKFHEEYFSLIPKDEGFILSSKSYGKSELYHYDEYIKTAYFSGIVRKKKPFKKTIFIKLNGDNRSIYEKIIQRNLSVSRLDEDSNLLVISFKDTIPERASNYVNALIEAYINQSIQKKEQLNNKILKFLDEQLERTRIKLEASEKALRGYQSENKSVDPGIKSTTLFEKLGDIDLRLSEIVLKEKLIENVKKYVENNKNFDAITPTLLEFNDTSTIRLIDRLNELNVEASELRIEYTNSYPRLKLIYKRAAEIKKKIILNINNLASVLHLKHKSLLKQKSKYESILTTLPKKEKKLISFQRNYEVNAKMYTYLLEKKSENELIKVATVADYETVDKAYASPSPVGPKRAIVLVAALMIGFLLGLLIALLRAFTIDKVKTKKDVELLTKLPIYGNIPLYKENMLMNVSLEEAYRKLLMNLQFSKKEDEGNIVLVSSSVQGEGKTTTIVNLSLILQNTKYKSIIIDLDMHNPSIHAHFGMQAQYSGVSTYLSERDNLGNVIFTTNHPNLNIIPSGPTPPNPMELILSTRLEELLSTLKKRYDYIFIDTGSFDIAEETFFLMKYSDTNLIVLRENFSKKSAVADLEKIIREKQLRNVGLVLKTVPAKEKKKSSPVVQVISDKNKDIKALR
jgi:capsular exopolysaccharide synthesis family protein